ncbi:hypothetical protein K1W69_20215 [Hoeflea sp. WL0058]|uniref:YcxB-like protein domain-containing protein n=1 Tax=Flavimaribacter sediminis TaxID=2865987 RepID=A0AAE2ZMS7_9HYPH|nr:hypothetical protein [Flavimaribacter sediminis]MBW8639528.1 hypothetical protein [Flavimaribacter sediminis]
MIDQPVFSSTIDKTYEDDLRMVHIAGRHVRNSPAFKASRISIIAAMLAGFVLLTHWLNDLVSHFLKTDDLALLVVIVSAIPITFVFTKLMRFQFVHAGARNLRNIRAEKPETYEIGPSGVRVEGAGLSMTAEWRSIFSIVERPEFVAVLLGCSAIAIPARAFADAAERRMVIDYMLDKLPEDARKRSICRKPA